MARKDKKKKDDEQIVAILDQHILFSTGYADSNLTKERTRVLEYYDGVLPKPTSRGNSKYVSQDVFESVESLKASILEVFSTTHEIVKFDPSGANDVEPARIATEYCSFVVFRQNPGFSVLGEVIEDGLLARVGICQFSWEEETEETDEEVGPASIEQLSMHPSVQDDNSSVDSLDDHGDGTYTANLTKRTKRGKVHLECVEPEDFGITSRAKDIKTAKLCYRRKSYTRGELLEEGYTENQIDGLTADSLEYTLDQEKAARFKQLDDQRLSTDDTIDLSDGYKTYTVYHCYAKIDIDGTGIAKLWHIVKCGTAILSKEKVRSRPFAIFVPIPKAHSFHGSNFAGKVMPLQNARTVLTRAILDHTVTTTAPRWQVVKGGLMQPRELMDNRVGGIVNVTRPDAVAPLMQAPLNPFVFQTLGMLDQNKEDVTGVSRLSKGLNKDAISSQNSQGLVEDLVSLSERRQKIIARQFAEFLRELYIGIYQTILDHQDFVNEIEVAGNFVQIDPRQWRERTLVSAEISVGYGEMDKEAAKWVQIDQYLSNPQLGPMYTPDKRYNVISRALKAKGVKDIDNILVPLAQQKPPAPDPAHIAEVQAKTADAQSKTMMAQATMERTQFEHEKWRADHQLKAQKEIDDHAIKSDALSLKERAQAHREAVDAAEIALQKKELEMQPKLTALSTAAPKG